MSDELQAFSGFRDHPESPFFRAEGLTPEQTWDASVKAMARQLLQLEALAEAGPILMTSERLVGWHRAIFIALFPADAGRLRWRADGQWEHVFFGGHVGTRKSLRHKEYRGTVPQKLRPRIDAICEEFNAEAQAIRERASKAVSTDELPAIQDATHACARLYAKILRAHPWVDGNLRAAFVALNAGLRTLDLPRIEFKDLALHDDLLGIAFRGKNDPYRPLGDHIAEVIVNGAPA